MVSGGQPGEITVGKLVVEVLLHKHSAHVLQGGLARTTTPPGQLPVLHVNGKHGVLVASGGHPDGVADGVVKVGSV